MAAVVGLVFGAVIIYKLFGREETLLQAATACMRHLERGDAKRLLQYVRADEKELLSLDEQKLGALLRGFFAERLNGFSRKQSEADRIESFEMLNVLQLSRRYAHPDGREVWVHLQVTTAEGGPKLLNATSDIVMSALRTYWPKEGYPPTTRVILLNYEAMEDALPLLETLPLEGMARRAPGGVAAGLEPLSWRELRNVFRRGVDRLRLQ